MLNSPQKDQIYWCYVPSCAAWNEHPAHDLGMRDLGTARAPQAASHPSHRVLTREITQFQNGTLST